MDYFSKHIAKIMPQLNQQVGKNNKQIKVAANQKKLSFAKASEQVIEPRHTRSLTQATLMNQKKKLEENQD